jgi:hypothetical protein
VSTAQAQGKCTIFAVTPIWRQRQPKSVVELLRTGSTTKNTATSAQKPTPDPALGRYLDAQRARETQAALADHLAGEYARALEGADSQERYAAAIAIAEAYEEARSLTQIELDLMVSAKVIGVSDCTERQMDIQDSSESDESFGLPADYVRAAAHWRYVAEMEQAIHLQELRGNLWRADGV